MTRAAGMACATEAIAERFAPARAIFDDAIREGRRAIVRAQHAADDAGAAATLIIRRRPLAAVMIAGALGALTGAAITFGLTSLFRCKDQQSE